MLRATAIAFMLMLGLATARAATLAQVFPELAGLPEAQSVTMELGWAGLSQVSPLMSVYALELRDDTFAGTGTFSVGHPPVTATRAVTLPRAAVQALLAAAAGVAVEEKAYAPRFTHTDDYPSLAVTVPAKQGSVRLHTETQPRRPAGATHTDQTPWAIEYMGRTFVVTASDLDRAMEQLDPHLPREPMKQLIDEFKSRPRPSR